MRQGNSYRLLQLKHILYSETDELHELDIYELRKKLLAVTDVKNIDVRTIKKDLDVLQKIGFDIVENRREHGRIFYSHQVRTFETYEIRMLVDAVLSARFITIKQKTELIDKLRELTSIHIGKTLPEPVVFSQTINVDHEMIKLNIDQIHQAISEHKVLGYLYGDYNVEKEFIYRREKETYLVEPYALIWQDDQYYLIGKFLKTNEIRHYRVDRMRKVHVTAQSFKKEKNFNLNKYVNHTFNMYAGEEVTIKLRFHNALINPIYDRFGMKVDVKADGPDHFILKTRAKLSDGLVSWILKWGSRAQVLSPKGLVDKVQEEVRGMFVNYY